MANGDFLGFETDRINIFYFILDASGSMEPHKGIVCAGLEAYKKSFEGFSEAGSIAVSINKFNDYYRPSPFKPINEFNASSYYPFGGTALYSAIVEGKNILFDYIKTVILECNCIPIATFLVLSDGMATDYTEADAKEAIKQLNEEGISTVFIPCGEAITSEFGKKMGFQAVRAVEDKNEIESFFAKELSNSCKIQSQSMRALGSEFFSQNTGVYSEDAAQALGDPDFFGDDEELDELF